MKYMNLEFTEINYGLGDNNSNRHSCVALLYGNAILSYGLLNSTSKKLQR